jgi:uncharacterized protein
MDTLNPVEIRVLGALAEKDMATPEYYPLSLNALVNACNQKTNREPVMELSEDDTARALDALFRKGLAGTTSGAGSRVEKYRHLLDHVFRLDRRDLATLTVLMLRGPQTAGEVRGRTGRTYEFESLEEVEEVLADLAARPEPLVARLPLSPGRKEHRYAHTLGGPPEFAEEEGGAVQTPAALRLVQAEHERLAALEARVEALESEMAALREAFGRFREQFE